MSISTATKCLTGPAPCRGARWLLAVATVAGMLIVMCIAANLLLRDPDQAEDAGIWMQALMLTTPALRPAGSLARHPETAHPAVDPRFAAGLEDAR